MIYLTYSDPHTGVYQSQVIDVCNFLNTKFKQNVLLIALISIRGYWKNRKKIKKQSNCVIVVPMFPTILLWKLNLFSLLIIMIGNWKRPIIARGVLSCNLALMLRKLGVTYKVCYDGRAAIAEEYKEYNVTPYKTIIKQAANLEQKAVLESDYRIAVSKKLVNYWADRFDYQSNHHVVIPSTVSTDWTQDLLNDELKSKIKKQLGLDPDKITLVYSGSTAGWQSFDILKTFIETALTQSAKSQILLLSQPTKQTKDLHTRFKTNIIEKWVNHVEVESILKVCDYGLLLREPSITNQVAAPVKFAEYLSAGLNILISEYVGDASEFLKTNNCGKLIPDPNVLPQLEKLHDHKRSSNQLLAKKFFTKSAYYNEYKICIDHLLKKK